MLHPSQTLTIDERPHVVAAYYDCVRLTVPPSLAVLNLNCGLHYQSVFNVKTAECIVHVFHREAERLIPVGDCRADWVRGFYFGDYRFMTESAEQLARCANDEYTQRALEASRRRQLARA